MEKVRVDPVLLKDGKLSVAIFAKTMGEIWVLQSDHPKTDNIDEYDEISKEDALKAYPELAELFDADLDRNVVFRKLKDGRWCDFV